MTKRATKGSPLDADGECLRSGDRVESTSQYDADSVHHGVVIRIEEASLVVVRHDASCCPRPPPAYREMRSAAFLWRMDRIS
jgi:hypothetical protein